MTSCTAHWRKQDTEQVEVTGHDRLEKRQPTAGAGGSEDEGVGGENRQRVRAAQEAVMENVLTPRRGHWPKPTLKELSGTAQHGRGEG